MTPDQIIETILELAGDEERRVELLEATASSVHEALYDAALEAFETWEGALVEALATAASQRGAARTAASRRLESQVERRITEAFEHPLYIHTTTGDFLEIGGPELEVTDGPLVPAGTEIAGPVQGVHYIGQTDTVFVFSTHGRYFGIDVRMIPNWPGSDSGRTIRDLLFLEQGEAIEFVMAQRTLSGRLIHITRQGKGKATDADEFARQIDKSGREAFLLAEGDSPCAVLGGPEATSVFCASAMGQGIHFDAADMRSMGRKAVGVNVMKLAGDEDAVVSALLGHHVRQLAVVTEEGFAKRVEFDEFRLQGRGGSGMQLIRLNTGDRVAAVTACNPLEDLALVTSHGRVHRMPTIALAMMGRPARGNRIIELDDGERVVGLSALPCGSE